MDFFTLISTVSLSDYILIYLIFSTIVSITVLLTIRLLYPVGTDLIPEPETLNPVKSAALRGNEVHVIRTVLFDLYCKKLIQLDTPKSVIRVNPKNGETLPALSEEVYTYLSGSVTTLENLFDEPQFQREIRHGFDSISKMLQKQHLLKIPGRQKFETVLCSIFSLILLTAGTVKIAAEMVHHRPVAALLVVMVGTVVLLWLSVRPDRHQTPHGIRLLRNQEEHFRWMRTYTPDSELRYSRVSPAYSLAVFGEVPSGMSFFSVFSDFCRYERNAKFCRCSW